VGVEFLGVKKGYFVTFQSMQSIYISDLPTLSLRDLSRLGLLPQPTRQEIRAGEVVLSHTIAYSKDVYKFRVEVSSSGRGTGTLSFRHHRQGREILYTYPLITKESNLPTGGTFFVISYRGHTSTKLYLYDDLLCTRHYLSFLEYETQAQSKRWREIEKRGNINQMERVFRKGGKIHYRGKLTPYGERLCRYWEQIRRVYTYYTPIPPHRLRSVGILSGIMSGNPT
jgi:hypothetical protein